MTAVTITRQGFAPTTFTEARQFAEELASSSLVPKQYQGKPQDILVAMQWGHEVGLAPMQALQNIAVINGKPSVYGDAAMALVQASPVCEDVQEFFEGEGSPNPVAVCVAKRRGRNPVTAKFSVEDAKRAGLWGKAGPWQAYPKRMMQMRARGFALRDAFPDVLKGLITAEEAQDYPAEAAPRERDITPRNPLDRIAAPVGVPITAPAVIEQQLADTIEPDEQAAAFEQITAEIQEAGIEVIEIPEVVEAIEERAAIIEESGVPPDQALQKAVEQEGYPLRVPGKTEPHSMHISLEDWLVAYNQLADKTATAGRAEPRTRMTKLRELKEANEKVTDRLAPVLQSVLNAAHQRRLKILGASLDPSQK
jgi:hypothetical protein